MAARTVVLIRSDSPNWDGLRAALETMADVTVVGDTSSATAISYGMTSKTRSSLPSTRCCGVAGSWWAAARLGSP